MNQIHWKPIKDYENLYLISDDGRVVKLPQRNEKPLEIKAQLCKGYYKVHLWKQSQFKSFCTHRLVAEHFIKNENDLPVVNHKNGIKTDNRVENLEWCTHSDNDIHAFKSGLRVPIKYGKVRGEKHGSAKLTETKVKEIRKNVDLTNKELSEKYGVALSTIIAIKNRRIWKWLYE